MDKKILLAIGALVIIGVGVFILVGSGNDEKYIGEEKAIEIFNNINKTDDFKMIIVSGDIDHGHSHGQGSVFSYSHLGYPKLEKVDSVRLTSYEGKKVYEFVVSIPEYNITVRLYMDAETGEFIK